MSVFDIPVLSTDPVPDITPLKVVELGELDPEVIITPGIFVKRVVQSEGEKK
jgi:hypothetical protein